MIGSVNEAGGLCRILAIRNENGNVFMKADINPSQR